LRNLIGWQWAANPGKRRGSGMAFQGTGNQFLRMVVNVAFATAH
jgi:hypothetical protein